MAIARTPEEEQAVKDSLISICAEVFLRDGYSNVTMKSLSEEAGRYLTGMMIIMAVYMIGRCVNTVTINGVLDGGGDTVFDMYSLAVCMWGLAIPLALLGAFVFGWPVLAVYACTCLDEVGKIPWVMLRFRKYKWVKNLTRDNPDGTALPAGEK